MEHYEPAPKSEQNNRGGLFTGGEVAKAPDVYVVKYDLEAGRRYAEQVFEKGELCLVSEKLHGASARYVFLDGQMHCGSRNEWKKEYPNYDHVTVESLVATGKVTEERAQEIVAKLKDGDHPLNMWWQALLVTPSLRQFCENNPGTVVYGEVYGCQDLNYGLKKGVVKFAAFDAMKDGRWLDATEFYPLMVNAGVPTVPFVAGLSPFERPGDARPDDVVGIPFDFDKICELAEGKTLIPGADHVREGVVVAPIAERYHQKLGRVKLKWVGAGYLERSK